MENVGRGIREAEPEPSRDADSSTLQMGNSLAPTRRILNPRGPGHDGRRAGQFHGPLRAARPRAVSEKRLESVKIWAQGLGTRFSFLWNNKVAWSTVCEPLNAGLPPKKHLRDLTHRARRSCPNRALTNTETHRHTAPGRSCAAAVTRVGE